MWRGSWWAFFFGCMIFRTPLADTHKSAGFSGHAPAVYGQLVAHRSLASYELHFYRICCILTVLGAWKPGTPALCLYIPSITCCNSLLHTALLCMLVLFFPLSFLFSTDVCVLSILCWFALGYLSVHSDTAIC